MVKLKESSREPIRKDRYYIWTWRPDTTNKRITEKSLYRKHLTGIPYFTRYQIKKTLVYMYGVDVLQYIHIISGRKLLRQGIRILQDMNGLRHKSDSTKFWYKGRLVKARKFIIPDEYKIDKHRRRRFMVQSSYSHLHLIAVLILHKQYYQKKQRGYPVYKTHEYRIVDIMETEI